MWYLNYRLAIRDISCHLVRLMAVKIHSSSQNYWQTEECSMFIKTEIVAKQVKLSKAT